MLVRYPRADLAALVVWVPMRGAAEKDVPDAVATIPDRRARHFWDATGEAMRLFSPVLQIRDNLPAWDIYLLSGPDARWEAGAPPPAPLYWAHQVTHHLYEPMPADFLDPALFSDQLARLLPKK